MSGFRGGGGRGGRGGGRGGMTRGGAQIPMGTLTWSEFKEVDKQKPSKAYPVMDEQPVLSKATPMELKSVQHQLRFLNEQKDTIWWPVEEDRRKRDLARYSDKFHRSEKVNSSLSLRDDALIDTLQKDAFPSGLWNLYMTAETKRQEKVKMREQQSTKKSSDWKRLLENVELTGGDQASDRGDSEDEDEGQLDEYEDDEDGDGDDGYGGNYFDNGEDDDVGDEAEGGAEETYE